MTTWQHRAATLADELVNQGKLTSPEWIEAMRAVPRHVLVPHYYEYDHTTSKWVSVDSACDDLEKVYSNTGLYTKIDNDDSNGVMPLSSTSTPGLMARMLEMLDIRDGHRVLEIGTGTGYNAALLAHRLGDASVFSVDIDAELVALAHERLASLGYHPTLAAVDGANGMPEHAPFDRIIATCSVPAVPWHGFSKSPMVGSSSSTSNAASPPETLSCSTVTATTPKVGSMPAGRTSWPSDDHKTSNRRSAPTATVTVSHQDQRPLVNHPGSNPPGGSSHH